jgi:DNA adenine methylase
MTDNAPESPAAQPADEARPILKWAGGKRQLLPLLEEHFPQLLREGGVRTYAEPFIGGAAVYLHVMQRYRPAAARISDSNPDIINLYLVVRDRLDALLETLSGLEAAYLAADGPGREARYYANREAFNAARLDAAGREVAPAVPRAAYFAFLNKTCFNGLTRYNKKGLFNVPFGKYANPTICDADNLRAFSRVLRGTEIRRCDFEAATRDVRGGDFLYYDPPYRPISRTSSFTAYTAEDFNDAEQVRLAATYRRLHGCGVLQLLSNSDPRNGDPDDAFFDELYAGFAIARVSAARMINSVASKRGPVTELLIRNY